MSESLSPFDTLSDPLIANILRFLLEEPDLHLALVCKKFYAIVMAAKNSGPLHSQENEKKKEEDAGEDDTVDPRVQGALEELNRATDDVNKIELDSSLAQLSYGKICEQLEEKLEEFLKKHPRWIKKAEPYYLAKKKEAECERLARVAASNFSEAGLRNKEAAERVAAAEKDLMTDPVNSEYQEELSIAVENAMRVQQEKHEADRQCSKTVQQLDSIHKEIAAMEKKIPRTIQRVKLYFDLRDLHTKMNGEKKTKEVQYNSKVEEAKSKVTSALKNLERLSLDIRKNRGEDINKLLESDS